MTFNKQALKTELLALVSTDLAALERAQHDAQAGATHEEAKPEGDKDTRAVEQTYLARGQALRVGELRAACQEIRAMPVRNLPPKSPAGLGALLRVEEEGEERYFFLAPHRGGSALAQGAVQVVSPKSPLGEALLGARAGEYCDLELPTGYRSFYVLEVL